MSADATSQERLPGAAYDRQSGAVWVLKLCADGMAFSGITRTCNIGAGRVRSILARHGVEL